MSQKMHSAMVDMIEKYSASSLEADLESKEVKSSKVHNLLSPDESTYPSTKAITDEGFAKITVNGAPIAAPMKIAHFSVSIPGAANNIAIDYSAHGFSSLMGCPIVTLIQATTGLARAGFAQLHTYSNTGCTISVFEAKNITLVSLGESLEFASAVTVEIKIFGL